MKKILCTLLVLLGISAGLHAAESDTVVINQAGAAPLSIHIYDFNMTIEELKGKIYEEANIPVRRQRLIFAGQTLEDAQTLDKYNIKKNLTIHLLLHRLKSEIYVKPHRGEAHTIEIDNFGSMTIAQVKEKVEDVTETPVDVQQLIFAGKRLDDDQKALADYGIKKESIVRLKLAAPMELSEPTAPPVPRKPVAPLVEEPAAQPVLKPAKEVTFSPQKKVAIGVTLAALTAAVTGYITKRLYQNKKKRLVKKYKLGNLTKLQDKIWLATTLASYGVPQRLRSLVRNNPGTLASFTGKDPRALAELYYGHAPSQKELDAFISKFFSTVS